MRTTKYLITLVLVAVSAAAPAVQLGRGLTTCKSLSGLSLLDKVTLSATPIAAGRFKAPDGKEYDVPSFCRVQGLATPTTHSQIHLEVWLPDSEKWSGRYYQHGQGGGGGSIDYASLASFIRDGAAGAATDDGHGGFYRGARDLNDVYSRSRSDRDSEKFIDLTYRALGQTTATAKSLIRRFYGRLPRSSYFEGCSGGGDYAWQAVQRFPDEWNGILVGAPSIDVMGLKAAAAWNSRTWFNPKARIDPRKLPAIQKAALTSCGPQAHVVEGVATDPRFCFFDPTVLLCKGEETDNCLTAPQMSTLKGIYEGPRNPRTGEQIFPGYPPTAEAGWAMNLTGGAGPEMFEGTPTNVVGANRFYRDFLDNPEWSPQTFDFDQGLIRLEDRTIGGQPLRSLVNVANADLSPLKKRGIKVVMYVGWADAAITPLEGIAYYEKVSGVMGGISKAQSFFRLFMVPGMSHCGVFPGPGTNVFGQHIYAPPALKNDPSHHILRALEAWVETGRVPERIIAGKYVDDDPKKGIAFTRPLCPYPQVAIYKGGGDPADASNFECREESAPH